MPGSGGGTADLNRYRFTVSYLWHVWLRYCPTPHRQALQRRLIAALESLYALDLDQVSPLLAALYDATGQPRGPCRQSCARQGCLAGLAHSSRQPSGTALW